MKKIYLVGLVLILSGLSGCLIPTSGLKETEIIMHPDADLVIVEVKGTQAKVALYDAEQNKLVIYGWVDMKGLKGKTVTNFDWQKFIKKRGN